MKISRDMKVVLYLISAINELVDKGFLTEDVMYDYAIITDKRTAKKQLKNFIPTEEELMGAIHELIDLEKASNETRKVIGGLGMS